MQEVERDCAICSKKFMPHDESDACCSPFCRSMYRIKVVDAKRNSEDAARRKELESLTKPPKFDLIANPKARAEWFMSLPESYRKKFRKYLTEHEIEIARGMAQKTLAEERYYSGFYVKNGKIVESKSAAEKDKDEAPQEKDVDEDADDE